MYFIYFNFIPNELLFIIASYFDNDSLENALFMLVPEMIQNYTAVKLEETQVDWNYIYYLHFNKTYPNKDRSL